MNGDELIAVPRRQWAELLATVEDLRKRLEQDARAPRGPQPLPGFVRFVEKSRAYARRRRGE